jgi:uncharacterized alpha-E superfamily protein
MLSRVADNLYWMSRYLERAEHTARLVDVNLSLDMEQSSRARERRWARLLATLRTTPPDPGVIDPYTVARYLTFDPRHASSVLSCISSARENARQVREQISSEMWEQINRFYLTVRNSTFDVVWRRQPHEFFRSIKEGVHFFQGLTDSTLGHEEGWQFIQVGRYLERAVNTAALLGEHYAAQAEGDEAGAVPVVTYLEWVGLLRSCTAFEAYCRVYTADLRPDRIASFLLLDPAFPHSVRFSVEQVGDGLDAIARVAGASSTARVNRLAGRLSAALRFSQIEEVMAADLQAFLADIEAQCLEVHNAMYETYVAYPIERAVAG